MGKLLDVLTSDKALTVYGIGAGILGAIIAGKQNDRKIDEAVNNKLLLIAKAAQNEEETDENKNDEGTTKR